MTKEDLETLTETHKEIKECLEFIKNANKLLQEILDKEIE